MLRSTLRPHRSRIVFALLCAMVFAQLPIRAFVGETAWITCGVTESIAGEASTPVAPATSAPPAIGESTCLDVASAPRRQPHPEDLFSILRI